MIGMIERVAVALDPLAWAIPEDDYPAERARRETRQAQSLMAARKVIEEMRDPLYRMTIAGHAAMDETEHTQTKALGSYMGRMAFVDVWKAMIDEALK